MEEFRNNEAHNPEPGDWYRVDPPAPTTFVGQPVSPPATRRITTPLPGAALPPYVAAATTANPTSTPATLQPVARKRRGVSGLLLIGMLILGMIAGGVGG